MMRMIFIVAALSLLGCKRDNIDEKLPKQSGFCCNGEVAANGISCEQGPTVIRSANIPYAGPGSVDLQSLDIYGPEEPDVCQPAPILLFVHGGGWKTGDKDNDILNKATLFTGAGFLFVSINYRLSPNPPDLADPNRIQYPIHEQDVAAAIAFVQQNAASFGGDPNRIALLGHSAGAHLVALVATDESFLAAHSLSPEDLRCVASLDTEGYDIPFQLSSGDPNEADGSTETYTNAFGDDPAILAQASPINHLTPNAPLPFLLVERGSAERRQVLARFQNALQTNGFSTEVIDANKLSHQEVTREIGAPNDTIMTAPLMNFLTSCLLP
jgi:arylformamidase